MERDDHKINIDEIAMNSKTLMCGEGEGEIVKNVTCEFPLETDCLVKPTHPAGRGGGEGCRVWFAGDHQADGARPKV